jgi:DNA-binding transcriptional MerR regulator
LIRREASLEKTRHLPEDHRPDPVVDPRRAGRAGECNHAGFIETRGFGGRTRLRRVQFKAEGRSARAGVGAVLVRRVISHGQGPMGQGGYAAAPFPAKKYLTFDMAPGFILKMRMLDGLTIGDLAANCGVSRDTLRFYERERLLSPPRRSASGYRLYGEADGARVRFIRRAQATGLTLDDIRELLRIQQLRTPETCRRVAARLKERIEVLDRKMLELKGFRGELAEALAQCEEGAESCPVVLAFARDGPKKRDQVG